MNIYLFVILSFFSLSAIAEEGKMPCMAKDGRLGLDSIKKFDCDLAKNVVKDAKVKEQYEETLYNKLAEKLANKITQSIEDMTLLDQFYSHHKQDLRFGNDEVIIMCRLEVFAEAKCSGKKNLDKIQARLELIKSKFPKSKMDKDDFFDRLSSYATSIRAPKLENKLQCPVFDKSGYFLLQSQLSEVSAKEILSTFTEQSKDGGDERNNKIAIERMFTTYPQLKLLKNAENSNDKDIMSNFKNYLKGFDPNKHNPTEYVNTFFLSTDNQPAMAKGLVAQCESVNTSVKKFLCDDLAHLGASADFTEMFFEDGEDEKNHEQNDLNRQVSKGFSCDYKKVEDGEEVEDLTKLQEKGSLESVYGILTENTRPTESQGKMNAVMVKFCDLYSCKSVDSKELNSCKSGGPVSFKDLEKFCLDPELKKSGKCDDNIQKYISYLKTLDDINEIVKANTSLASSGVNTRAVESKQRFSSFFENFVGVKGSLLAEGRPITQANIAEKSAEFVERKISLSSSSNSKRADKDESPDQFKSEKLKTAKIQQETEAQSTAIATNAKNAINVERFMKLGEERRQAEKERQELIRNSQNKYLADSIDDEKSARNFKPVEASSKDRGREDEIKQLRSELANIVNSVKGSEEERLATIARNNRSLLPSGSDKYDSQKAANQAEKERLARYRENLNGWEGRLRNWEGNLNSREFAVRNSSGARVSDADKRRDEASRTAESFASNGGTTGSGLHLTKLASNGVSAVGGAIEGGSKAERAIASTDGIEGEVILNSDKLATLEKSSLKALGVAGRDSFIIKVRHKGKFYNIPVKIFIYKEKEIYVPLLSENNKELAEIVVESPLFSDYRDYEKDKKSI
jgi:hypothetical protein